MTLVDNDLPPIPFSSAGHAFAWAEEQASRPDYRSPAATLVKQMVGQIMPRGRFRAEDYRDLAHTILAAVASIDEPHPREAFRYCFGQGVHRASSLASTVAQEVLGRHGKKQYHEIARVAGVAVFRCRTRKQWARTAGLSWYARALRIKRESLYDGGWMDLIKDCENVFDLAVGRGEMLAEDRLGVAGVL